MLATLTRGPRNIVVLMLHSPGLNVLLLIIRDKASTLLAPLGTAWAKIAFWNHGYKSHATGHDDSLLSQSQTPRCYGHLFNLGVRFACKWSSLVVSSLLGHKPFSTRGTVSSGRLFPWFLDLGGLFNIGGIFVFFGVFLDFGFFG